MTSCKRIWEAEAARDGRLLSEGRAQFERHSHSCADCAREQRKLDELARRLRELHVEEIDELSLRRRRQELLARANADRMAVPRPQSRQGRRLSLAAVVVLLASSVGVYRAFLGEEPVLAVEAERGSSYRRYVDDGVPVITLDRGRLSLTVKRGNAPHGVRIRTPDGIIEDVGTTFSVLVEDGRTELVEVSEGQVLVSLRGQIPRLVSAGETHRPYDERVIRHARDSLGESPSKLTAPDASPHAPPRVALAKRPQLTRRQVGADTTHAARAERAFATAVSVLKTGDASEAALLFWRFERSHHDHPLAEDASYLRIVALMRASLTGEARAAGRAYLDRYPRGFRRPEVEHLLFP